LFGYIYSINTEGENDMAKTRHINQRMNQRGINEQMLEIVKMFGVDKGDKTYLNRKGIEAVEKELKNLLKQMDRMKSRGGIVLVESGECEVTTYSIDSYNRSLIH
jgi:fructose-1-phosphate kinase PfkB-like protein